MKTVAAFAALALAFTALPAGAATFLTESAPAADGSITWFFGNTGGVPAGAFDDQFDILFPSAGLGDGSVIASFTSKSTEETFTSVSLGSDFFTLFNLPGLHGGSLAPVSVLGGHRLLDIKGISPGIAGDYAGTLSFTPNAVPEPAAWALMIVGFGMAGGMVRARKRLSEA